MPNIAKDVQTGFLISASNGIKKRKYSCVCPDAHAVCLRQGEKNAPHFAHIPVHGQDNIYLPSCRSRGESEDHIMAKHKLVEWQGRYRFTLKTCEVCRKKVTEDCINGTMQIEVRSEDKKWRYDVLFTRHDGTKLALEVYHTHATGDDKVTSSTLLGVPIAEFDAQDILNLQPGGILDNKRDASWICSQGCVNRKQREEQELLRQQQEKARALKIAKRREADRILEERKKGLEAALASSRAMEKYYTETTRQRLEQERKSAQEQAKTQKDHWQVDKRARYEKDLREWEACQRAYKKFHEIKLPFEK